MALKEGNYRVRSHVGPPSESWQSRPVCAEWDAGRLAVAARPSPPACFHPIHGLVCQEKEKKALLSTRTHTYPRPLLSAEERVAGPAGVLRWTWHQHPCAAGDAAERWKFGTSRRAEPLPSAVPAPAAETLHQSEIAHASTVRNRTVREDASDRRTPPQSPSRSMSCGLDWVVNRVRVRRQAAPASRGEWRYWTRWTNWTSRVESNRVGRVKWTSISRRLENNCTQQSYELSSLSNAFA